MTHAQVSVNPSNMRIGYHVDWAAEFPFEELGLPNRYPRRFPPYGRSASKSDGRSGTAAGAKLRTGIDSSAQVLTEKAVAAGLRPAVYRKRMEQQYRRKLAAVRSGVEDVH